MINQKPSGESDRQVGDDKHARLVTAVAIKRNRFVRGKETVSGLPPVGLGILSAQSIHEKAQAIRQRRTIRLYALLQPLTNGITDRPAGPAVDRLDAVVAAATHDGSVDVPLNRMTPNQVMNAEIVSDPSHRVWVKIP
jgi:hypothetical protein